MKYVWTLTHYNDNFEDLEGIFSTKEKAIEYAKGLASQNRTWQDFKRIDNGSSDDIVIFGYQESTQHYYIEIYKYEVK